MTYRRNARRRRIQAAQWAPGKREADEGGSAPRGSRMTLAIRRRTASKLKGWAKR